jgi:hypothetical protein
LSLALAELGDALFESFRDYGLDISAGQQDAIARAIDMSPVGTITASTVDLAVERVTGQRPPRGMGVAVLRRWREYGARMPSLLDMLLDYRQWAIDALSAEHGGKPKAEETLRNNLRAYLPKRAHVEARTGRGKTDIYIPELDAVIEVKVWTDRMTFNEGIEELARYIRTSKPRMAFMVIFGDRHPLPKIVDGPDQEVAEPLTLGGLTVPVVVVTFEVDFPSKALEAEKRRVKNGQR